MTLNKLIPYGFIIAGLMNSSVLFSSRFFTNETINEFDPSVMSNFGLLMILIWGIAYVSVAFSYEKVKWLVGVFAIEKLIYGLVWLNWMQNNNLADVYAEDTMTGSFYASYGINDWVFFVFFSLVFVRLMIPNKTRN